MRKYILVPFRNLFLTGLVLGIIVWTCGLVDARGVSFGVRGGVISQSFAEEKWGAELWKALGGLIEIKIPGSPFAVRGDVGAGLYQREDPGVRTTKTDLQIEVGPKYLYKIASPEVAVYGGEASYRVGICSGLGVGLHLYTAEEKQGDSVHKEPEMGIGLHFWGGLEYLISSYVLFAEVGWGKVFRGDIFQEEHPWTQLTFMGGVKF